MIPNKIYIPITGAIKRLEDEWMYEPQKGCNNAVFVLKEKILEWAEMYVRVGFEIDPRLLINYIESL